METPNEVKKCRYFIDGLYETFIYVFVSDLYASQALKIKIQMIDEDVYSRLFTCIKLFLRTRLFYEVVTLLHTEPNTSVTNVLIKNLQKILGNDHEVKFHEIESCFFRRSKLFFFHEVESFNNFDQEVDTSIKRLKVKK